MNWLIPLSYTSDGDARLNIRGKVYIAVGVSKSAWEHFLLLVRKNQHNALEYLKKFATDVIKENSTMVKTETTEVQADVNMPIPRNVLGPVLKGSNPVPTVMSGPAVALIDGGDYTNPTAVLYCTADLSKDKLEEEAARLNATSYIHWTVSTGKGTYDVLYSTDPVAVLEAVNLRLRDIGTLEPPLCISERKRLAQFYGFPADKVKSIEEQATKAVQAYLSKADLLPAGDDIKSDATTLVIPANVDYEGEPEDEECLSWMGAFKTESEKEKFLDWAQQIHESKDSESGYMDSWRIVSDKENTVIGLMYPSRMMWLQNKINEAGGVFDLDLDTQGMEDNGEDEDEGLRPGMVRAEVDVDPPEAPGALIVRFPGDEETDLLLQSDYDMAAFAVDSGVVQAPEDWDGSPSSLPENWMDELEYIDQVPEEYYQQAKESGENMEPESGPEDTRVPTIPVRESLEEAKAPKKAKKKKEDDPYEYGFHLKKAREAGMLGAKMKDLGYAGEEDVPVSKETRPDLSQPVMVGKQPLTHLGKVSQRRFLQDIMRQLNSWQEDIAKLEELASELKDKMPGQEELFYRAMKALGLSKRQIGKLVGEISDLDKTSRWALSFSKALGIVYLNHRRIYPKVLKAVVEMSNIPTRELGYGVSVTKESVEGPVSVDQLLMEEAKERKGAFSQFVSFFRDLIDDIEGLNDEVAELLAMPQTDQAL